MKKWIIASIFLVVASLSLAFTWNNATYYDKPIVKVTSVTIVEEETVVDSYRNEDRLVTQQIVGEWQNGKKKGKQVEWTHIASRSGAADFLLKERMHVFMERHQGEWMAVQVKRDHVVVLAMFGFIGFLLLVGGRQGMFSLISFGVNVLLLYGAIHLYVQTNNVSLIALAIMLAICFVVVSLVSVSGLSPKTYVAIVTSLVATFVSLGVVLLIFAWTNERGLNYEEMQFLSRPYRTVFIAGLIIGSLGAVMDVAMTMASTLFELAEQPNATLARLKGAGEEVGRDIMGTITSILFFAYMSGSVPVMLLYVMNDVPLNYTFSMNLSLEFARALAGSIGIVLAIPISLHMTLRYLTRKKVIT